MLGHFNNFLNRCARYNSVIFYLISISVDFPLPVILSAVAVLFWVFFLSAGLLSKCRVAEAAVFKTKLDGLL